MKKSKIKKNSEDSIDKECKQTKVRPRVIAIVITLFIVVFLSLVVEAIGRYYPVIQVDSEHFKSISEISMTSLVILGLIIGTILQFALREANEIKFGYTANERVLYFNTLKFFKLNINLFEMLLANYLLIPIALILYILVLYNMVISIFICSIFITFFEFLISMRIIANNTLQIDNNCKKRIQRDVAGGNFEILQKMLDSFYDKMNDKFYMSDEHKFFTDIVINVDEGIDFPMYYIEVQRFISNLIYGKKLNISRILYIAQEFMFRANFKADNSIIIYIDDAIIWAANNTNWETKSLFQMLEICHYKFENPSYRHGLKKEYELNKLMELFFVLFIGLENDYYNEFSDETISYHQKPFFSLIRHYVKTRNNNIIRLLSQLNKKENKMNHSTDMENMTVELDFSNAKLKYLVIIKLSYYFFTLSNENNISDEHKAFILKVVNDIQDGRSFAYYIKNLRTAMFSHSETKLLDIRKDDFYDYIFPLYITSNNTKKFITYLICLSILTGIHINYESLIEYELEYAMTMFEKNAVLKQEYKNYMKNISSFYGINYTENRIKNIYKHILPVANKYKLDFNINAKKYKRRNYDDIFDEYLIK